ncbi:hypothetical protein B0H63DRAFT_563448 [Podospora didyma]|uniref:Uncharacterized protein n=1 Tax=Podospora didyma TaxID=330526 RepID=A0AAE0K892_9PEZI|nr:hypothetical protein B0H63DRAFT_563448 [Podospora didyma]
MMSAVSAAIDAANEAEQADWYKHGCKPGTYACAKNPKTGGAGWKVCNTSKQWVYAGDCPWKSYCYFNKTNGSPYCIPWHY